MTECLFVGGMWQEVENEGGLTFITGRSCPPPTRNNNSQNPMIGRIDLCPPEFGGDGSMRLTDPRCVRPSSQVSAARAAATFGGGDGGDAFGGLGGYTGSVYTGGGGAIGETEEVIVNGESGNGAITFRANVSGCGCETPGDPASAFFSLLPWITLAIAIYAATKDK